MVKTQVVGGLVMPGKKGRLRSNLSAMRSYGRILKPESDTIRLLFWKNLFASEEDELEGDRN